MPSRARLAGLLPLERVVVAVCTVRAAQGAGAGVLAGRACHRWRVLQAAGIPGWAEGTRGRPFLGGVVAVLALRTVHLYGRSKTVEIFSRSAGGGVRATTVAVVPRAASGALIGAVAGRLPLSGIAVPVAPGVVIVDHDGKLWSVYVWTGWGQTMSGVQGVRTRYMCYDSGVLGDIFVACWT